ncbi:MAG: hypothetical protein JOY85_07110 [Acidobacteriaceae bacterium]|nr:hypothetical protein [Acidobacteriaceae bacterium]
MAMFSASAIAWSAGHLFLLPLCLLLPFALGLASTRRQSLLIAVGYFAGALWPMIPGASVFFGNRLDPVRIVLLYATWVLLLASPFYWVGHLTREYRWRIVAIIISLEAFMPIGLASPFVAAGALFPGLGWIGLLLLMITCVQLVRRSSAGILCLLVVCAFAWIFFNPGRTGVSRWEAFDTQFGGSGFQVASVWEDYSKLRTMAEKAQSGRIAIFPENTIHLWVPEVSDPWFSLLLPPKAIVIFGAERRLPHQQRQPVVLVRGALQAEYQERFPVPLAMWGNDTPMHYFGSGSVQVGSARAGMLLCYEQLLPVAALQTFAEKPDVLVAPANLYWAKRTTIDSTESLCVRAWAQLFAIPYYRAVNE